MSGGLFEARAAGTLVVKASFWIGSTWIGTFGCAAWKAVAACCQTVFRSPAVALVHHVRVTCEFFDELAVPPLPPQAARATAAVAAMAIAAHFRMLRMLGHLLTTWAEAFQAWPAGLAAECCAAFPPCQSLSITF